MDGIRKLRFDPKAFREALLVDTDQGVRPLGQCLDEFQRRDFDAMDPAWQQVVGNQVADAEIKTRALIERGRGASKSTDAMVAATFALFASQNPISGIVCACDKDQAKLDRDHVAKFVRHNKWLDLFLDVGQYKVTNKKTGSELTIISSDVASSWGLLIDFAIFDEYSIVPKRDLFDSVLSAIGKKRNAVLYLVGNAGFVDSWAFEVREAVKRDKSWYFSRLDHQPSWITQERLDEQRRLLPAIAFARLWQNQWTSGSGDALSDSDLVRSITLPGLSDVSEDGMVYLCGVDLSLTRDKSAAVVIAKDVGRIELREKPQRRLTYQQQILREAGLLEIEESEPEEIFHEATGRTKLVQVHVWDPLAGGKIDIERIESKLLELHERFGNLIVGYDPWQAAYMSERLQKRGVPTRAVEFTGKNLCSMCSATLEAFGEGKIDLYSCEPLLRDLRQLRVSERSYGVRLESPRGPSGHGDTATALAIALHVARDAQRYVPQRIEGDLICFP